MKEKILALLNECTHVEGRYIGGGEEPQIIVLTNSEDSDKESFLSSLADSIIVELITEGYIKKN